ncbi:MAG: TatD family hydrolase [Rikenellaceae bacterium]|nr:TatD family hydrolase [Rikenellaceae bacterium]
MKIPYIDIHSHDITQNKEILKIYSILLGNEIMIPQNILFSAGIHPRNTNNATDSDLSIFENKTDNLLAIGEIGLDFSIKTLDKEKQLYWFEKQLRIATELQLPVIIHCVKAYYEVIRLLKKYPLSTVIFHSFIGNNEIYSQINKNRYFISLSQKSLRSTKTMNILKNVDVNYLFIESDEKDNIFDTYLTVSAIIDINPEKFREIIYKNFISGFNYVKLA